MQTFNVKYSDMFLTIPIKEDFSRLTLLEETAISGSPFSEVIARGSFEIEHAPEHLNLEHSLWTVSTGPALIRQDLTDNQRMTLFRMGVTIST